MITDPPIVTLRLGSTLVVDDIKESDDIYFECDIKANPPWRKLSWLHDVSDDEKIERAMNDGSSFIFIFIHESLLKSG